MKFSATLGWFGTAAAFVATLAGAFAGSPWLVGLGLFSIALAGGVAICGALTKPALKRNRKAAPGRKWRMRRGWPTLVSEQSDLDAVLTALSVAYELDMIDLPEFERRIEVELRARERSPCGPPRRDAERGRNPG